MAYNKARAEMEWLKWKNKEENQLRELGVDEDTIQRLHTYDWDVHKKKTLCGLHDRAVLMPQPSNRIANPFH